MQGLKGVGWGGVRGGDTGDERYVLANISNYVKHY